jgi:hypothetical protein
MSFISAPNVSFLSRLVVIGSVAEEALMDRQIRSSHADILIGGIDISKEVLLGIQCAAVSQVDQLRYSWANCSRYALRAPGSSITNDILHLSFRPLSASSSAARRTLLCSMPDRLR